MGAALDAFLEEQRRALHLPGLAACVVKRRRIVWSKGYGWADIARRVPMDPDRTLQNIGSISKTVVATALMQLWEQGKLQLDDDVAERLPFPLRSPAHPETPVTYRHLLTHRSGIADGPAYGASYGPGDPKLALDEWLREYFTIGGRFYDRAANFHAWKPGSKSQYSNLGFGLLGYLVERISGDTFSGYTRRHIFEPLEMKRTGWHLSEIETAAHAIPYGPAPDDPASRGEIEAFRKFGLLAGDAVRDPVSGSHQPLALYGFPNYPDGGLRTSVNQLARLLIAYASSGAQLLKEDTVRLMLTPQTATESGRGLCWAADTRNGKRHWGHNGSDPGIRTNMSFRLADGVGAIVFVNRAGVELNDINTRLFQEAARF